MEFTSHLGSVHKLLQSTCSVPGIDATQQKYTHDPGKHILCRCLKNKDSAECGHQVLIINYFFKRRNKKITRFHVYTVIILKIEAPELWSKHFWQKNHKKTKKQKKKQTGKTCKQWQIFFSWAPKLPRTGTAAMKLKDPSPCRKNCDKPRLCIRNCCANKGP